MSGSRAEWVVLVVLLVVIVAASALVGDRGTGEGPEARPDPSTYNGAGSGSKGLYLWLREMGVRVERWERPLGNLPRKATILLVLGPRLPVGEQELEAVREWGRGGGVLVLADAGAGAPIPGGWAGAPALKFGLRQKLDGKPTTLRPAFPSPYVEGVDAIEPQAPVRFQRQAPEAWAPLFADAAGDVLALRRVGRGTLIAIADPGLFSNARLEAAGHARLILNVVRAHAGEGEVLVDEFHHGHGDRDAFSRYLKGTAVPWVLGQGALAFLAFLLARGTRFGAPVPASQPARASSLEYVAALGDLYGRAGARGLASAALAGSLRRDLTAALGTGPGEETAHLASRAARRLGVPEEQVKRCLAPGPGAGASDEALLKFAQDVHRLEGRLLRRRLPAPTGPGDGIPNAPKGA